MPISLYKERGETPLESLNRLRKEKPKLREEILSYAGRLDPMAEGLLLVLIGDENKRREKYLGLDKSYEVEILFGFATDTYDPLGIITEMIDVNNLDKEKVKQELNKFVKTFLQPYPRYSSKSIANDFKEDLSPKEVTIYSIDKIEWKEIKAQKLLNDIVLDIGKVQGNFRQEEIIGKWKEKINNIPPDTAFPILQATISTSSGVYIRSLAHNLGKNLNLPSIAYKIKRIKIGEYRP